jgi:hypothetical protein
VEISDSAGQIQAEEKRRILKEISRLSLDYIFEVSLQSSPSAAFSISAISRVREAFELKSNRVIVNLVGHKNFGQNAYEEIPWDPVNEIAGRFGPPSLIFKTSRHSHRTALILEFGPSVNLAGIPVDMVHSLEMQRLGFATETFGLSRPVQNVEGSPAAKFIYHLIRSEHPVDQTSLIMRSGLPKRTVQGALRYLVNGGFVRMISEASDLRRHKYALA